MPNEKAKPLYEFQLGRIQSQVLKAQGPNGRFPTTKIVRLYEVGGTTREATTFSLNDLPAVAHVAYRTWEWLVIHPQEQNGPQHHEPADAANEAL